MFTLFFRWQRLVSLICILVLATACFQQVSDNADIGTVVAQADASDTPMPTETPVATETEVPSDTPTPTEEETETVESLLDQTIGERATATATSTDTPTATEPATETPTGVSVAQEPTATDEFPFTATAFVVAATQTAAFPLTLTAAAQGIGATPIPTETPTSMAVTDQPVQPTQQLPSGADCVHQVRRGTTMFRLSVWYGLPIEQIATYNSIANPALIREGQKIIIPNCGTTNYTPPPTYTPQPPPGTVPGQDGGGSGNVTFIQHTVDQYETLFDISMQYGVPIQRIAAANGITNTDLIYYNDVLQIPISQ